MASLLRKAQLEAKGRVGGTAPTLSGSAPRPLDLTLAKHLHPSALTSSSLFALYLLALACLLQEFY